MGPKTKAFKYFSIPRFFLFFCSLISFSFYILKNSLSGKPFLVINILKNIIHSLTKLCRMEDKHVLSMTEPLKVCTACLLIFYKALDLVKKCKIPAKFPPIWYHNFFFKCNLLLILCQHLRSLPPMDMKILWIKHFHLIFIGPKWKCMWK